jgi:hypothetical protein
LEIYVIKVSEPSPARLTHVDSKSIESWVAFAGFSRETIFPDSGRQPVLFLGDVEAGSSANRSGQSARTEKSLNSKYFLSVRAFNDRSTASDNPIEYFALADLNPAALCQVFSQDRSVFQITHQRPATPSIQ